MPERIPSRVPQLVAIAIAGVCALVINVVPAAAAGETVYSNVPAKLAPNYASVGAEAYSYAEFGGQVELVGTNRNKPQIEVVMSIWACQFGKWDLSTCETPQPTKKFKWPLTLKLYEVGEHNAVGEKLGEVTKTFAMPYRPSDDVVHCTEGRWYDAATSTCFHGFAFAVKFPSVKVLRLPKRVIVGISYDTSHYGPKPVGGREPCNAKSGGCYYDALNVGLAEPAEKLLTVGADPTEPYIDLANAGALEEACGNSALLGKFGPTECGTYWEGDQPLLRIAAH